MKNKTIEILDEFTGDQIALHVNAEFVYNDELGTAVVKSENGYVELEWVEQDEKDETLWTCAILPTGVFAKVIVQ